MEIKGDYLPSTTNSESNKPILDEMTPNNLTTHNTSERFLPNLEDINNLSKGLKSYSGYVFCPYCKTQVMTKINKKISIINLFCCTFTLGVGWFLWQTCRGKNLSCYNVEHSCRACGTKLSEYKAC